MCQPKSPKIMLSAPMQTFLKRQSVDFRILLLLLLLSLLLYESLIYP